MNRLSKNIILALFFLPSLILSGCSNSYVENIDRGSGYNYQPGYPELRAAVTGHITENSTPTIIVSGEVVYGSMVYNKGDSLFEANALIEIQIQERDGNKEVIQRIEFQENIRKEENNIINSQDAFRFEKVFEVPPGDYIVRTTVMDEASGKQSSRTMETTLPNPSDSVSHITEIRILGKDTSEANTFHQATTYDIPGSTDSLKFVFQVTNNSSDNPLELQSRLLKFRSDTSIARPMYFNNYSPSSLPYIGIDYDEHDEIQSSTRTLSQPGSVVIEFMFSKLERGNYRLEVTSTTEDENELYKARDFSVKSLNYPSLKTPLELARPLHYLMSEEEYEELLAIKDAQELKQAIDRFWLSNIQNSKTAQNVISLYYERVEEANKQFSNYKEGWKTDPGMIYILFGPPLYSDSFSNEMVWSYSYNQQDPEKTFLFNQSKLKSKFYPFYNYLLQRDNFYYSVQYQQVERWRTGTILSYNL